MDIETWTLKHPLETPQHWSLLCNLHLRNEQYRESFIQQTGRSRDRGLIPGVVKAIFFLIRNVQNSSGVPFSPLFNGTKASF